MTTILDEILAAKQKEVERLKDVNTWNFPEAPKETHALAKVLKAKENVSIIAEFKRASPSKGIINADADPVKQAITYKENGADAISVLTDATFFKGSYYDLQAIQNAVDLPVLCKDFVIDEVQIHLALHVGATVVLLIAAALSDQKLKQLYRYASSLSLDAIVEVHNEAELERALAIDAAIIGVNNRDLKTFTIDLSTSEKLGPAIRKAGKFLIAESGIHKKEDVIRVRDAGAHAILVGEAFMTSSSVKDTISDFKVPVLEG